MVATRPIFDPGSIIHQPSNSIAPCRLSRMCAAIPKDKGSAIATSPHQLLLFTGAVSSTQTRHFQKYSRLRVTFCDEGGTSSELLVKLGKSQINEQSSTLKSIARN
ncbi:hypothetical protein AcW1_006725 [Taiwanofungus camphoratus]|nr:hypothetical protein AcV5_009314 [Antrodia cinnamomea]KAI0924675.1 hypothetical protein AcW2_005490 [Antrodia cinnamomea]KAI0953965.1 hypothetical protein AcV7_007342 [Antrodia cinnamomea]KAI0955010.1 hypothetical protein AcW1_006725 [Antrodia cinnamomea]